LVKSHLRLVSPAAQKRTVTPKRRPNADLRTREYLTQAEVERLLKATKENRWGHRDATMILVAYRHGLRASELTDLRWDQIDFATATLHVRRVKQGSPSTHPILGDELRWLRRLQREQQPKSPFVLRPLLLGRGLRCPGLDLSVEITGSSVVGRSWQIVPQLEPSGVRHPLRSRRWHTSLINCSAHQPLQVGDALRSRSHDPLSHLRLGCRCPVRTVNPMKSDIERRFHGDHQFGTEVGGWDLGHHVLLAGAAVYRLSVTGMRR
jgi:integrase